jgi:pSer/pThr/pTyr-binding forkhead associated (FHA) protein
MENSGLSLEGGALLLVKRTPMPQRAFIPLSQFISKYARLEAIDFLDAVPGPLLMYRIGQEPPILILLGRVLEADKAVIAIGRHDDCDIVYKHSDISAHHLNIHYLHGRWHIIDKNSTNGTYSVSRLPANRPIALENRAKYKLANVMPLQFWKVAAFYKVLQSRGEQTREMALGKTEQEALRKTLLTEITKRQAVQRLYRVTNNEERDLLQFSNEIHKMTSAQFRELFPCPFLVKLTASSIPIIGAADNTLFAKDLVTNRGLRDLKYWPIGSKSRKPLTMVGRAKTNDIVINHATVSKTHAVFSYDAAQDCWAIEDLESKNGILLDGQLISESVALKDEICLRFGKEVLVQFMTNRSFHNFAKLYSVTQQDIK